MMTSIPPLIHGRMGKAVKHPDMKQTATSIGQPGREQSFVAAGECVSGTYTAIHHVLLKRVFL